MSYKEFLVQRIKELELQIANNQGNVEALKKELNSLAIKEFEEDLREENQQILLKG